MGAYTEMGAYSREYGIRGEDIMYTYVSTKATYMYVNTDKLMIH